MTHEVGARLHATVGAVAHGGHCVSRVDGRVAFVRHALPGERVVLSVTEDRGKAFFRADAVEILEASPDRVSPECAVSGPGGCGGCDFQHVSLAAQRELKAVVLAEQLSRLGGVERWVVVEELPAEQGRWRTRVRFAVDGDGRAGFRASRAHRVIPVDDCPISVSECVDPVVGQRFSPEGEVVAVRDSRPEVSLLRTPAARSGRRGRTELLAGDGEAVQQVFDHEFVVRADGFWQVHPAAAETFSSVVLDFAQPLRGEVAWDLYGGAGLFAAPLVDAGCSVTVVESSRNAVHSGRSAVPDARFIADDVARVLSRGDLPSPDLVVLDPPRKGAGAEVLHQVCDAAPSRIVYVACDPAALGRDTATLLENGYELVDIRAFDAFPMTHHFETIALFIRGPRSC